MPDDRDYSADLPPRSRRRDSLGSPRERDDDDLPSARREVPKLVRTAGIIWIIFGGLMLVTAVGSMGMMGMAGNGAQGSCNGIVGILFGIAFLFVGVQSIKGTAKDTLGNGIGSIVIGALNAGVGVFAIIGGLALSSVLAARTAPAPGQVTSDVALVLIVAGAVNILSGVGLIVAGTLALMGRAEYKAYRHGGRRRDPIDD